MNTSMIDKLAAFCRLADKGYRRDPDGYWVQDRPGLDRFAWRPDESDDDCRVVLEECRQQGLLYRLVNTHLTRIYVSRPLEVPFWEWLLLASPAEKCAAVLKVLGDA